MTAIWTLKEPNNQSSLDAQADDQERERYAEHEDHFKTFWDQYDFGLELKPESFNEGTSDEALGRKIKAMYHESFAEFHGNWRDA